MDNANIPNLLLVAWLLPLVSFTIIVFLGPKLGKHGVAASWVATAAIVGSFLCSATSFVTWWDDFREFGASAHVAGHEPEFGGHAAPDAAKAAEDLALNEQSYKVGAKTFLDVATARATYEQQEVARVNAIYDYQKAFAALENAVGRPLR